MKPSSFIFWVEPDEPPAQRRTSFCLFQNVMSRVHSERPEKLFSWNRLSSPRGAKSRRIRRRMRNAASELNLMSDRASKCISYTGLFMWIWKISTFSPDLAVTWGFLSKWHFSLCPSECMLYECVTMNSLCIFTWKKTKKETAQGYRNPRKRLVQLNLYVIN